jgi:hypothetical protein
MSTNSIDLNDVNESTKDNEAMDVEKLGIIEEEGKHQSGG